METKEQQDSRYRALGLKILSVVGFILVLVFGAWGVIQIGRSLPQIGSALSSAAVSLTSIFVPAERLSISIPPGTIASGQPFTFSWTHTGNHPAGTYTVSFGCSNGLTMQIIGENNVYKSIACNTPFTVAGDTTQVSLVPTSNAARFVDVPFKVEFTRLSDGKASASAEATLTVTNSSFVEPGSTPATTTPSTGTQTPTTPKPATKPVTHVPAQPIQPQYTYTTVVGRPSNPNGNPDLAVTILDVRSTNNQYYGSNYNQNYYNQNYYYPTYNQNCPPAPYTCDSNNVSSNVIHRGDTVVVRFVVENLGNKAVEAWNFSAVLPTMPMDIYSSEMQPTLMPGDKMQFTISFDKADPYPTNGAFTVNVDPSNMIWNESNKNNNIAKTYLNIIN